MARGNDFDFEDDIFGSSNSSDSDFDIGLSDGFGPSNDSDSEFGDFGSSSEQHEVSDGKSQVIKQAAVIAIIGILLIALGFGLVKWLTGGNKDDVKQPQQQQQVVTTQPNNPQTQVSNQSNNGWNKFSSADNLVFYEDRMAAEFTITAINHYVKVVDSENNLSVKTVLTGSISGFIGTYELEVPYYKGCQLSVGNHFKVQVQVGESNGKLVVGDIQY